jgi:hypothetical protein
MLDKLTHADFAAHLHSRFRIRQGSALPLEVELIEATPLRQRASPGGQSPRREPFSLLFRGPASPWLPQCIYPLEHAQLGTLDLFLVPVGPDEHGMRYEAIFT